MPMTATLHAFDTNGFAGPFDLARPETLTAVRETFHNDLSFHEAQIGLQEKHVISPFNRRPLLCTNTHLAHGSVMDLARDPAIITALTGLMGTEIYLRRSQFWRKPPKCRPVVWHQDTHKRRGLGFINEFSAWVALEDATIDNGCLWVLQGSSRGGIVPQNSFLTYQFQARFYNSETLEIPDALAKFTPVPLEMKAGQFVLFHQLCFHASGPNKTEGERIGLAFRYLPADRIDGIDDVMTRVCAA